MTTPQPNSIDHPLKATPVSAIKQYRVSLLESTSYAGWVTTPASTPS